MNGVRYSAVVLLTGGIALAGCSQGGSAAKPPSTGTAQSPTATADVPTEAKLGAGLLTAGEVGTPYTVETPAEGGGAKAEGCQELADLENGTATSSGEVSVARNFTAGPTGPFITETLAAEPVSSFERDLKANTDSLASCKHLKLTEGGDEMSFDLSPVNFAEDATAMRLDGTYQGIPLNGYIAIQRVDRNVALLFDYLQIGSGSSQEASSVYSLAASKATRALGSDSSATTPPAEPPPPATPSTGPGDVPVARTVRAGQPFEVSYDYADGGTAKWDLMLSKISCGGPDIFDRKILAAHDASVPQPEPGMQFCLVKFNITNEGNSNDVWTANTASVNVGMRAYASSNITGPLADAESAYNYYADPSSQAGEFGLNPGVNGVSWAVFEIPAGATATSVSVPIGTSLQPIGGGADQILIEL